MHSNWRDCKAWADEGLAMNTTCNEAAKMFDATLSQYVSWSDNPSVGGMENTMKCMVEADPDFVLGHVLSNGLMIGSGKSPETDEDAKKSFDNLELAVKNSTLSKREEMHVKAVKQAIVGDYPGSIQTLEDLLLEHPTDMLAVKMNHDRYFSTGRNQQMRDSIARVLPQWKETIPLYNWLYGMHAFGLEESGYYDQALKAGRKGIELNRKDPWAIHAVSHVYEMTGRVEEGLQHVTSLESDWSADNYLSCHNYWHWGLFCLEKGDYEEALSVYDNEISKRLKGFGALIDGSSFLHRLRIQGVEVGKRWDDLYIHTEPLTSGYHNSWMDIHTVMACCGAKHTDQAEKLIERIKQYASSNSYYTHDVCGNVVVPLSQAFVAYEEGDYEKCVELIWPLHYDIISIAGSNAQRDVFDQFLIHACLQCGTKQKNQMARLLLNERKAKKENSQLTDRLIATAMAKHLD